MITLQNEGELDLTLMRTMGVNVKDSDDSIGTYGTGLKYAVAVFLREGVHVRLFIGENEYTFYTEKKTIRGKSFDLCCLKGPMDAIELPFTTELGKNWETWQAYREIHSNCLDENGKITPENVSPKEGYTTFYIDSSITEEIQDVFLDNEGRDLVYSDSDIDMYGGTSDCIYYNGIRAKDLNRPSLYTYNIKKECILTEDRLLCYDHQVREIIGKAVSQMEEDKKEVVSNVITAEDSNFEGALNMDYDTYVEPSQAFLEVAASSEVNRGTKAYIKKFEPVKEKTRGEKRAEFRSELINLCDTYDVNVCDEFTGSIELTDGILGED